MIAEEVQEEVEERTRQRAEVMILERMWGAVGKSYRGEIWEDDANVGLSQDDAHGNQPFDINTCWYWMPILQLANRDSTRMICITAANQIAKSLICELIARHKIKHAPGNMCLYDQTEEASNDHMKTRFMPFLRSVPAIREMIDRVVEDNRWDATTTDILLPGMILRGRPLNESSTQRITLKYVFVHDACLSERNGQLRNVRKRFTQFEGQELFVVESQGGKVVDGVPDDFTNVVAETDDADLWVCCPVCDGAQNFTVKGWAPRRVDDFQARVPWPRIEEIMVAVVKRFEGPDGTSIQEENLESRMRYPFSAVQHWIGFELAWERERLTAALLVEERRVAGFKRGDESGGRSHSGVANEPDIMQHTYYECLHCGEAWQDTPATRYQIDHSSHYIPTKTAGVGKYGVRIPAWINSRISWGKIMFEKVLADHAVASSGNDLQLQEWETKRAAATFDPKAHMARVASVTASIDPLNKIPDELFRSCEVDCQKDKQLSAVKGEDMTGHFWVTMWATDKQGNDVQLWRGYCVTWEEWITKYKELGIPTKNVSVDISFKPDEVKAMAARHAEVVTEGGQRIYATWTMMRGSDNHSFRWEDGVQREYKVERPEEATVYTKSGSRVIKINVITWSNFRIKNILQAQLTKAPGSPRMTTLPGRDAGLTERTRAMEIENCTWDNQMNSELLGQAKRTQWLPVHKENHYRDCKCMQIVRKLQAGVAGRMELSEQDAQKAS